MSKIPKKGARFVVNERANRTSSTLGGRVASKGNTNTTTLNIKSYTSIVDGDRKRLIAFDPLKKSIFPDEWGIPEDKIMDMVKKLKHITIENGIIWCRPSDDRMIEYLRAYPKNADNDQRGGKTFREVDFEKAAEERLRTDRVESTAKSLIYNGKPEDVIAYAMALGLRTKEDDILGGHDLPYVVVESALVGAAMKDPEGFIAGWDDESMKYLVVARKALNKSIIVIDAKRNSVYWRGGGLIISAPNGVSPLEYFAENADQSEQNWATYERMAKMVEGSEVGAVEAVSQEEITDDASDVVDNMTTGELFEAAQENGIIIRKGGVKLGYYFEDEKIEGGVKFEKVVAALDKNPDATASIREKLSAVMVG